MSPTATAILFGTAPALRATRVAPNEALREQGRGVVGEGRVGAGGVLVIAQVALSLLLVVGAGLFVRTFSALANRDLGFDRDPLLVVNIDAGASQAKEEERTALFDRVRESVAVVPGVARVALSAVPPVGNMRWNTRFEIEGGPPLAEQERSVNMNLLSPGWFAAYGMSLRAGRDFTDRDGAGAPPVAIVNEAFVRKYLSGGPGVGRRIRQTGGMKAMPLLEIVGVVEDAVYSSVREVPPPTAYIPYPQSDDHPPFISVNVRSAGPAPAILTRAIADAIGRVDRDLALTFRPLKEQVTASLGQERLVALLSGFFGALALLLAGLGLYGVTAYAVSRRRSEIGIRLALGAEPSAVIRLVLRRVAALVGAGVIIGAAISLWAARFVKTLLYGLEPHDAWTLATAALVLATVGALAGWIPARRAARIDPATVLRET